MKVLHFPLVKPTLCFMTGLAVAHDWLPQTFWVVSGTAISLVFLLLARLRSWQKHDHYFALALWLCSFCIGLLTASLHDVSRSDQRFTRFLKPDISQSLTVVLQERLRPNPKQQRYVARVTSFDTQPCQGKILLQLNKIDFPKTLAIGSRLQLYTNVRIPAPPKNPGQFDYAAYLRNKGILAQAYPTALETRFFAKPEKSVRYYANEVRDRILGNLQKSGLPQSELTVVAALILGQQQDISPEINQDYQFAGAVHILSVSGLHVGFILMFLNLLLALLPNTKRMRLFKLLFTIGCLWGFAFLAGCAPSVIRSVTMCCFVAVGLYLRRGSNIFHTLIVSMLLILLFEPSFLFDVGFQLSYLALFFILWLEPLLGACWQPENKFVLYAWRILTVSVAAQLGTLPLSVYYFHQFPGLFFVTNLVVIPMLTVIMALGVLHTIVAACTVLNHVWLLPFEWSIKLLNGIIAKIASVDSWLFQNIPCNLLLMLCAYVAIVCWIWYLERPKFPRMVPALLSIALLQAAAIWNGYQSRLGAPVLVLNQYKSSAIVVRATNGLLLLTDSLNQSKRTAETYARENFTKLIGTSKIPNVLSVQGKRILVIDHDAVVPSGIKPHVLLLRQSPKINLDRFLDQHQPQIIVADGSNFKSYAALWERSCLARGIRFHNIARDGYWEP